MAAVIPTWEAENIFFFALLAQITTDLPDEVYWNFLSWILLQLNYVKFNTVFSIRIWYSRCQDLKQYSGKGKSLSLDLTSGFGIDASKNQIPTQGNDRR